MSIVWKRRFAYMIMLFIRILVSPLRLFCKMRPGRVVFSTFNGKGFGDNSKYIALELIRRKLPLELIWITSPREETEFPPEIRRVSNSFFSEFFYLSTGEVWVDTHFKRHIFKKGLVKKKNQLYIQTWHGSLGIKNIPTVEQCAPSLYYPMITDLKAVDCLISNSIYEDIKFRECFSTDTIQPEIKKLGHPRNDVFFQDTKPFADKVRKQYGLSAGIKIFTYMPTFRKKRTLDAYQLDFQKVIQALEASFGGDWCIFMRLHPDVVKKTNASFSNIPNVIDVSRHPDPQELLVASDILCTDYSSCIYDFILTRRPGFIFTVDMDNYNAVRGLRYPLTETPFPIAQNNEELAACIRNFDKEQYLKDVEMFLKKHGCVDDGHASERVADVICNFIEKHQEASRK